MSHELGVSECKTYSQLCKEKFQQFTAGITTESTCYARATRIALYFINCTVAVIWNVTINKCQCDSNINISIAWIQFSTLQKKAGLAT